MSIVLLTIAIISTASFPLSRKKSGSLNEYTIRDDDAKPFSNSTPCLFHLQALTANSHNTAPRHKAIPHLAPLELLGQKSA
jgi:hypothetical protein